MSGRHDSHRFPPLGPGGSAPGDEGDLGGAAPSWCVRRAGGSPGGPPRDAGRPGRGVSAAERELVEAIQAYQRSSGRMFPTWSEVLEVLESLGYSKA
jgi:hypothetical protein